MTDIIIMAFLPIFGATFGSFAMAQVWRLRASQLKSDKEAKEEYDKDEYSRLKKLESSASKDRSRCLSCGYQLKWYDLIPIVSWVALRGRCRKCHKKIGITEILAEVILAALFLLSYIYWPFGLIGTLDILRFTVWLIFLVPLTILFLYDLKFSLMPSVVLTICLCCAIIFSALNPEGWFGVGNIINICSSIAILSGIYYLLYKISNETWVGSGDFILAAALAIVLSDWRLSFATLFISNLIGCFFAIPSFLSSKRGKKGTSIPLGPLLIAGFLLVYFFQEPILAFFVL